MLLRKEFLIHRKKTVDAFSLVSADISNIHISLTNLKNLIESMDSRISELGNGMHGLRASVDRCISDINFQKSNDLVTTSTIRDVNTSITEINGKLNSSANSISNRINSVEDKLGDFISNNKNLSSKFTSANNSINKLLSSSKSQAQ